MKKTIIAATVTALFASGSAFAAVESVQLEKNLDSISYNSEAKVWEKTDSFNEYVAGKNDAYDAIDSDGNGTPDDAWQATEDKTYKNLTDELAVVSGDFDTAEGALNIANANLTASKATLETKSGELDALKSTQAEKKEAFDQAKAAYDADPTTANQTALTNAQSAYDAAASDVATKQGEYDTAKSDADAKELLALTAQTEYDTEKTKLEQTDQYAAVKSADAKFDSVKSDRDTAVVSDRAAGQTITNNSTLEKLSDANSGKVDGATSADKLNNASVTVEDGVLANNQAIHQVAGYAEDNRTMIYDNSTRIDQNSARITQNTTDIKNLRQDFERLSKDYYSFKEQTNGAIAGVAAMGQLAQPYGVGNANVGVGVGAYNGEQAIAIGVGYRYSESTTMRAALAANSGNDMEPIVAASLNYEW